MSLAITEALKTEEGKRTAEEFLMWFRDPRNWEEVFSEFLKIKTKRSKMVPFVLNRAQRKALKVIVDEIERQCKKKDWPIWDWASVVRLRIIFLKARQQGISTLIQAIIFITSCQYQDLRCKVVAHKTDSASNLFDMYKRYVEHFPPEYNLETVRSNEKKVKLEAVGSEIKIASAETPEEGRSDTVQMLHLSELAFYRDQQTYLTGGMQIAQNAILIAIESTAKGVGNEYHNAWMRAVRGQGEFIPIFLSWLEFEHEYSREVDPHEENEILSTLDEEEKALFDTYGATVEQLAWRRNAIVDLCHGNVRDFHQEYPAFPEEAFLSTGSPVFNSKVVNVNMLRTANLDYDRYELYPKYDETKKYRELIHSELSPTYKELLGFYDRTQLVPEQFGRLVLYVNSIKDLEITYTDEHRFAIGVDVAEGLAQGDFSVISVFDRKTKSFIMEWRGKCDPDLLAKYIHQLYVLLRKSAMVCVEFNSIGAVTVNYLADYGVPQYYRVEYESGRPQRREQLGHRTTTLTKPIIINRLAEAIRGDEVNHDGHGFWSECSTFVRNERGQMAADGKIRDPGVPCFDDRVMSVALAYECHTWMPAYRRKKIEVLPSWAEKKKKAQQKQRTFMGV